MAQPQLKGNPKDANALFAMTLSVGMQADYASLIDKQQLASLKMTREADQYAKKLLVVVPDATPACPERANHVWSYNFVSGRTQDGRTIRMLTPIDK